MSVNKKEELIYTEILKYINGLNKYDISEKFQSCGSRTRLTACNIGSPVQAQRSSG